MEDLIIKIYEQNKHKIKQNWDNIQKLIALENSLNNKLTEIENKLKRLWKLADSIYKNYQ